MKRQSEQSVVGPVFQQRRVVPQQRVFEFEISVVLRNFHVHRNVDHHRLRMHFGVRRMQPVPHPLQGQFPHNVPRANQMPIATTVVAVLAAVATTTPFVGGQLPVAHHFTQPRHHHVRRGGRAPDLKQWFVPLKRIVMQAVLDKFPDLLDVPLRAIFHKERRVLKHLHEKTHFRVAALAFFGLQRGAQQLRQFVPGLEGVGRGHGFNEAGGGGGGRQGGGVCGVVGAVVGGGGGVKSGGGAFLWQQFWLVHKLSGTKPNVGQKLF